MRPLGLRERRIVRAGLMGARLNKRVL